MGLMSEALVLFDVKATKKEDVIGALADAMDADGRLNDRDQYDADFRERLAAAKTATDAIVAKIRQQLG